MALGCSTSSRRLHPSCRLSMALAFALVFAFAFFLGRAPAGTAAPSSSLKAGETATAPIRSSGAAGTEAPGLVDILRSIKPVRATGTPPPNPASGGTE